MPDELKRIGDLELEEDIQAQRRVWRVQRVGWAVWALIAVMALLGLFGGGGPLNQVMAGTTEMGIQLKYPRFGRLDAEMPVRVVLQPQPDQDEVRVWISREYLDAMDLEEVRPEPSAQEGHADGVVYVFNWPSGGLPTTVTFFVQPVRWGTVRGRIGLPERTTVPLSHFVYP